MNPLATDFNPLTSPEIRALQPAAPAHQPPSQDKHTTHHPAALVPMHHFGQQPLGTVARSQHLQPDTPYYHVFPTAQYGSSLFPEAAWSQDGHANTWGQRQPFAEYHGPPDAHLLGPAISSCARQSPDIETVIYGLPHTGTGARSGQIGFDLQPAPSPEGPHMTQDVANRDNAPTHSNPLFYQHCFDVQLPGCLFPETGETASPTTQMAPQHGHPFATEDQAARSSIQSIREGVLSMPGARQTFCPETWMPLQSGTDVHNGPGPQHGPRLQATERSQPLLRLPSATRCSVLAVRRGRAQAVRRALRSGKARRQRLHPLADFWDTCRSGGVQDEASMFQSHSAMSDHLESPYAHPSPRSRLQHVWDMPSAQMAAASYVLSPAPAYSAAETSARAHITTPVQSPTQVPFPASVGCDPAVLGYSSSSPYYKPTLLNGLDDSQSRPWQPQQDQQQARLRGNKTDSSAQSYYVDCADSGFRLPDEPNVSARGGNRGIVGDAASAQHSYIIPGPPDTPPYQVLSVAGIGKLGNTSSGIHGPQMASLERSPPREAVGAFRASTQSSRDVRAIAESGLWSHSKRWISEETKERMVWTKMMSNLRHIGADQSPFIPQNLTELAAFKADMAEANRQELTRVVGRRLAELTRRKSFALEEPEQIEVKVDDLFWGKRFKDNLSPVFASENCFNQHVPHEYALRVEWPSLAELKEEGDKRGGKYRRYLPLPRLNAIDSRSTTTGQEDTFNANGTIRWQMKVVKPDPAFILPVSPPEYQTRSGKSRARASSAKDKELEPRFQELPEHLQATIRAIIGGFWDGDSWGDRERVSWTD